RQARPHSRDPGRRDSGAQPAESSPVPPPRNLGPDRLAAAHEFAAQTCRDDGSGADDYHSHPSTDCRKKLITVDHAHAPADDSLHPGSGDPAGRSQPPAAAASVGPRAAVAADAPITTGPRTSGSAPAPADTAAPMRT